MRLVDEEPNALLNNIVGNGNDMMTSRFKDGEPIVSGVAIVEDSIYSSRENICSPCTNHDEIARKNCSSTEQVDISLPVNSCQSEWDTMSRFILPFELCVYFIYTSWLSRILSCLYAYICHIDRSFQPDFDRANREFNKRFIENSFGAVCDVCDRLWFVNDLKQLTQQLATVLIDSGSYESVDGFSVCQTCRTNLKRGKIPTLSKLNGFTFPKKPTGLPALDVITERLVSPRLPFMQVRRLRFAAGTS